MKKSLRFFEMSESILDEWRTRDEHIVQGTALAKLMGDLRSGDLELALIERFGRDFRNIIEDFKKRYKSIPSPDDLIWIAGVHAQKDPRIIAKDLAKQLGKKHD